MTSLILKFLTGILAALIAHRIVTTILAIIVGVALYLAFANPKLLVEIINKIKDYFGSFSLFSASNIKSVKHLVE